MRRVHDTATDCFVSNIFAMISSARRLLKLSQLKGCLDGQKRFLNIHEYQVQPPHCFLGQIFKTQLCTSPSSVVDNADYIGLCGVQGAQLMAKYGIHVPEGIAATTIDGVVEAAGKMKDDKDEV